MASSQTFDNLSIVSREDMESVWKHLVRSAYRSFYKDDSELVDLLDAVNTVRMEHTLDYLGVRIEVSSNQGWFIGKDGNAVKHVAQFLEQIMGLSPIKVFIRNSVHGS